MKVYKPLYDPIDNGELSIFLGGSIEMGKAIDWQSKVIEFLEKQEYQDKIVVFNPRRDDWDSSWPNDPNFEPFKEQVQWELAAQSATDIQVYYFAEDTLSPITLLELGIFYDSKNTVIGCDTKYLRYGNLKVTCDWFDFPINDSFDKFLNALDIKIKRRLERGLFPRNTN